jgi:hypothetical protein
MADASKYVRKLVNLDFSTLSASHSHVWSFVVQPLRRRSEKSPARRASSDAALA